MTLREPLRSATERVESSLRGFMEGRTLPLYTMMAYHLGWVDQEGQERPGRPFDRVRGGLSLVTSDALGGDREVAAMHAVAVELLHNYSTIHADIQEGNPDRDDQPALWWVWGPAQGINAGDGMHALARLAIFSLQERGICPDLVFRALKYLDEAALALCEGAYLDTVFQERRVVTSEQYMDMVERLAGALVGAATRLGAFASEDGRDSEGLAEGLATFGAKLGTAMQLASDYAAFWAEADRDQTTQGRLVAKKKTLPVIHALEHADPSIRRELGGMYAQRMMDPANLDRVREILDAAGSREHTLDTVQRLLGGARTALANLDLPKDATASLDTVIRSLVEDRLEAA